jgi:hypothetical protein
MRYVALEAQERHRNLQHVIVDRTMRTMTTGAVLSIFSMLVHERPFLFRMALGAYFLHCWLSELFFGGSPVRLMAVRAKDLFFVYRVMAWHGELGLDFLMAAFAHIFHLRLSHCEVRPHMDIMAFKAGHIINRMGPCIPVVKVKI